MSHTYRSTVRSDGGAAGICPVVQLEVVVLTVARVVDAELDKGNGHHAAYWSLDGPFTLAAVGVGPGEIRTGEGAVVSVQHASASWKESHASQSALSLVNKKSIHNKAVNSI